MNTVKAFAVRLWKLLPEPLRASRSARQLIRLMQLRITVVLPPSPAAPGPVGSERVISTLEQLDSEMAELDRLAAISNDALQAGFARFRLEPPPMPPDPWSPEYRESVFELYEHLHGKPYAPANEVTEFELESHVRRPFPYGSGSTATVGDHLIGIAHAIRTLDLPPGSRVLELGAGWGNTTLALAQTGHQVTAVDIEGNFVKLITERAARIGVEIDVREGDFSLVNELEPGFDAVLFFESFHHAASHLDVIASLDRVVKPGGRVLFAGEPIQEGFSYPWGLRLDGESLWAIRRHGWFELGFQPDYFRSALAKYGWTTEFVNCAESASGGIFVARRLSETAQADNAD